MSRWYCTECGHKEESDIADEAMQCLTCMGKMEKESDEQDASTCHVCNGIFDPSELIDSTCNDCKQTFGD